MVNYPPHWTSLLQVGCFLRVSNSDSSNTRAGTSQTGHIRAMTSMTSEHQRPLFVLPTWLGVLMVTPHQRWCDV